MTLLTINGTICNIKDADLNAIYEKYKDFDDKGNVARTVIKVLDYLFKTFPKKIISASVNQQFISFILHSNYNTCMKRIIYRSFVLQNNEVSILNSFTLFLFEYFK